MIAEDAHAEVNRSHEEMTNVLDRLGRRKFVLMRGNVTYVADFMGKLCEKFKLNRDTAGLRELEENGFNEQALNEVKNLSKKTVEIAESKEFNVNIDGSFCAIGALGGAVLGFGAIAAPVLLIYSFMKSDEAKKALYEAKTRLDEARYYAERSKNISALFNAISTHGKQVDDLLLRLNRYFDSAVTQLKEVDRMNDGNYTFKSYSPEHKVAIFYAWQIMETVKTIIDVPMIHNDWSINPDIYKPIESGEQTMRLLTQGRKDIKSGDNTDNEISEEEAANLNYEGVRQYQAGNQVESSKLYLKAAKAGNAWAMRNLAYNYQVGRGIEEDQQKAFYWFEKAAKLGNVDAMFETGVYYYRGEYVPKDMVKSFSWCKKAAENGNVRAMLWTGEFYRDGNGVIQNSQEALNWFKKSADGGNPYAAQSLLSKFFENHPLDDIPLSYLKELARKSNGALELLLCAYKIGLQDVDEGYSWYKKAIDKGADKLIENYQNSYKPGGSRIAFVSAKVSL